MTTNSIKRINIVSVIFIMTKHYDLIQQWKSCSKVQNMTERLIYSAETDHRWAHRRLTMQEYRKNCRMLEVVSQIRLQWRICRPTPDDWGTTKAIFNSAMKILMRLAHFWSVVRHLEENEYKKRCPTIVTVQIWKVAFIRQLYNGDHACKNRHR